jgi:hypothetical protein
MTFIMLLGEMLMVKMGVSDCQHCLLFQWVTIESVATIASHVDCFGPKRLNHIVLTKH